MMFAESKKRRALTAAAPPQTARRPHAAEENRADPVGAGAALGDYALRKDTACPENLASPRLCPFGGACHACPARAQRKPSGGGQPLPAHDREFFEARFRHDFNGVRVHTGPAAAASADAMNAFAYTLGRDIFFGPGQYAPRTSAGMSLLAHELAHVVQQSGAGSPGPEAHDEAEANRARDAVLSGRAAPVIAPRGISARAQEKPGPAQDDELARLEKTCDLSGICFLRSVDPAAAPLDRVQAAYRKCRPTQIVVGDPCITERVLAQHAAPPAKAPAQKPAGGSSGLDLAALTTFKWGPLTVSLPSSVALKLQAPLSTARNIEFVLKAESSGTFSFSAKLNGLPHVTISASASADVSGKTASFGLTVATAKTVCHAVDPITTREKIKTAGAKVEKAMNALTAGAGEKKDHLKDLGEGIYDIYDAVDKAKKPCEQKAAAKLGIGAKIPWGEAEPGKPAPSPYVGVTGEVNF